MNAQTLPRHELAGLHAEVVESSNADLVGIEGTIVDETMHTLLVAGDGTKQVPKAAATFRVTLEDETVIIEGERLVARPARRTELTTPHTWR